MTIKTLIPPPLYTLIFATLMYVLDLYFPIIRFDSDIMSYIGLILIIGAIIFDIWSIGLFFVHKTTVNPLIPNTTTFLVIDGLYQYTRNPMYVGLLIILIGWAMRLGSIAPFLLLPLFICIITWSQIIPEEKILQEKFGEEFEDYKKCVPRWFW